jgi:hypothetical protein
VHCDEVSEVQQLEDGSIGLPIFLGPQTFHLRLIIVDPKNAPEAPPGIVRHLKQNETIQKQVGNNSETIQKQFTNNLGTIS